MSRIAIDQKVSENTKKPDLGEEILLAKKLLLEQSRLSVKGDDISKKFLEFLGKVKEIIKQEKLKCFISYAWPTPSVPHEEWIKFFLAGLRNHLNGAGIETYLDVKDCGLGDNIPQYMRDNIKKSDAVILIGNRSLYQKHIGPYCPAVEDELKFMLDTNQNRAIPILPILLSGSKDFSDAFPRYMLRNFNIKDWIREDNYFENLSELLKRLLKLRNLYFNPSINEVWTTIHKNFEGFNDQKEIINKSWTEEFQASLGFGKLSNMINTNLAELVPELKGKEVSSPIIYDAKIKEIQENLEVSDFSDLKENKSFNIQLSPKKEQLPQDDDLLQSNEKLKKNYNRVYEQQKECKDKLRDLFGTDLMQKHLNEIKELIKKYPHIKCYIIHAITDKIKIREEFLKDLIIHLKTVGIETTSHLDAKNNKKIYNFIDTEINSSNVIILMGDERLTLLANRSLVHNNARVFHAELNTARLDWNAKKIIPILINGNSRETMLEVFSQKGFFIRAFRRHYLLGLRDLIEAICDQADNIQSKDPSRYEKLWEDFLGKHKRILNAISGQNSKEKLKEIKDKINKAKKEKIPLDFELKGEVFQGSEEVFIAYAEACIDILTDPDNTYLQCQNALGKWGSRHREPTEINLAKLIEDGLDLPCYDIVECKDELANKLLTALDSKDSKVTIPWIRRMIYHGLEILEPKVEGRVKKDIECFKENQTKSKKEIEYILEAKQGQLLLNPECFKNLHEIIPKLRGGDIYFSSDPLYQLVEENRKISLEEKFDIYQKAGQTHYTDIKENHDYLRLFEAIRYLYKCFRLSCESKIEKKISEEEGPIPKVFSQFAKIFPILLQNYMEIYVPFSNLPTEYKENCWKKDLLQIYKALKDYLELFEPWFKLSNDLSQWELQKFIGPSIKPLADFETEQYSKCYFLFTEWIKNVKEKNKDDKELIKKLEDKKEELNKKIKALGKHFSSLGLKNFYQGKEPQDSRQSIQSIKNKPPWCHYQYDSKNISWFSEVAQWISDRMPKPPCKFYPFVLQEKDESKYESKAKFSFRLGIVLEDGRFNHHPFFSHWAELLRISVGLLSEYQYNLNISSVSHFCREELSGDIPDLIGTETEIIADLVQSSPHWLNKTTPMVWICETNKPPLALHSYLPLPIDSYERPHATALMHQWEYRIKALTSEQSDEKKPTAKLIFLEGNLRGKVRYLNPDTTRQIFPDEKSSLIDERIKSNSIIWQLTAKDGQFSPELTKDTPVVYLKMMPQGKSIEQALLQYQYFRLQHYIINYGPTGTPALLRYKQCETIVFFSSPAGLIFCYPEEQKNLGIPSSPNIRVMNQKNTDELNQIIERLDNKSLTQAVIATYLFAHDDDQLRNLGFEDFTNDEGKTVFRINFFDTATSLLPNTWIRLLDGKIQIRLKSVLFCLDVMEKSLNPQAVNEFLSLNSVELLLNWLKSLTNEQEPPLPINNDILSNWERRRRNLTDTGCLDGLRWRWERLRIVLSRTKTEDAKLDRVPHSHDELLEMADPALGLGYTQVRKQHKSPQKRFEVISKEYVVAAGVRVSTRTGLLYSYSQLKPAIKNPLQNISIKQAIVELKLIQRKNSNENIYIDYLNKQIQEVKMKQPFQKQLTLLLGDKDINLKIEECNEKRYQVEVKLERLKTLNSLWQSLRDEDLTVNSKYNLTSELQAIEKWEKECIDREKSGILLLKSKTHNDWMIYLQNGQHRVIATPISELVKEGDYFNPLREILKKEPVNLGEIRKTCKSIYTSLVTEVKLAETRYEILQDEKTKLENQLDQQRKQKLKSLFSPSNSEDKVSPSSEKSEKFLLALLDVPLRSAVLSKLTWGKLSKGIPQFLQLLALGRLTEINLKSCSAVNDSHVIEMISPHLSDVNLSRCTQITSYSIVKLIKTASSLTRLTAQELPELTYLSSDSAWSWPRKPLIASQLSSADFSECKNLKQIWLEAPRLRHLKLQECNIEYLTLDAPELKELSLYIPCVYPHNPIRNLKINSKSLERLNINKENTRTNSKEEKYNDTEMKPMSPSDYVKIRTMLPFDVWAQLKFFNGRTDSFEERFPLLIPLTDKYMTVDQSKMLEDIFETPGIKEKILSLAVPERIKLQHALALIFNDRLRKIITHYEIILTMKIFNRTTIISEIEEKSKLRKKLGYTKKIFTQISRWGGEFRSYELSKPELIVNDFIEYFKEEKILILLDTHSDNCAYKKMAKILNEPFNKHSEGYIIAIDNHLVKEAEERSDLFESYIENLLPLLNHLDLLVQIETLQILANIDWQDNPRIVKKIFDKILIILKLEVNYNNKEHKERILLIFYTLKALQRLMEKNLTLITDGLNNLQILLKNSFGWVKLFTIQVLIEISSSNFGKTGDDLLTIISLFNNHQVYIVKHAGALVLKLIEKSPSLFYTVLERLLILAETTDDSSGTGSKEIVITTLMQLCFNYLHISVDLRLIEQEFLPENSEESVFIPQYFIDRFLDNAASTPSTKKQVKSDLDHKKGDKERKIEVKDDPRISKQDLDRGLQHPLSNPYDRELNSFSQLPQNNSNKNVINPSKVTTQASEESLSSSSSSSQSNLAFSITKNKSSLFSHSNPFLAEASRLSSDTPAIPTSHKDLSKSNYDNSSDQEKETITITKYVFRL